MCERVFMFVYVCECMYVCVAQGKGARKIPTRRDSG